MRSNSSSSKHAQLNNNKCSNTPSYLLLSHSLLSLYSFLSNHRSYPQAENLLFYTKACNFEIKFSHIVAPDSQKKEELKKEAVELYEVFIKNTAPLCINTQSRNREPITSKIGKQQYDADMFKSAKEEIYNLMKMDSFHRYVIKYPNFEEILIEEPSESALRRSKQLVLQAI